MIDKQLILNIVNTIMKKDPKTFYDWGNNFTLSFKEESSKFTFKTPKGVIDKEFTSTEEFVDLFNTYIMANKGLKESLYELPEDLDELKKDMLSENEIKDVYIDPEAYSKEELQKDYSDYLKIYCRACQTNFLSKKELFNRYLNACPSCGHENTIDIVGKVVPTPINESLFEKLLYHGSKNEFTTLSKDKIGSGEGKARTIKGYWFTEYKQRAEEFGQYIYSTDIDIEGLKIFDAASGPMINKNNVNRFLRKYLPYFLEDSTKKGYIQEKTQSFSANDSLFNLAIERNEGLTFQSIVKDHFGYDAIKTGDEYIIFDIDKVKDFKLIEVKDKKKKLDESLKKLNKWHEAFIELESFDNRSLKESMIKDAWFEKADLLPVKIAELNVEAAALQQEWDYADEHNDEYTKIDLMQQINAIYWEIDELSKELKDLKKRGF